MQVLFIDGHLTHNNWSCIIKNRILICGHYQNDTREYFKIVEEHKVITRKVSKKNIIVVRQKSIWLTFMILCHELAHWLFDTILPKKLCNRFDNWLDRK